MLERDVRFLDSRIALLIQNRMALDEVGSLAYLADTTKKKHEELIREGQKIIAKRGRVSS